MPVYSYACTACGHAFDERQSFADATLTVCPECGGALRKRYDSIGVSFNGPGFYRTDSRSSTSSTTTAKQTSSTSTTSSSTSSTPKPAASSGAKASGSS